MELDSMTQTELASYLETLAKLVEATAKPQRMPQSALSTLPQEPSRTNKIGSPQPTTAQGA